MGIAGCQPIRATYPIWLHGFERGRLVIIDGVLQPARTSITIAELADSELTRKPVARGWLNGRT
jgi:hypothetical protein